MKKAVTILSLAIAGLLLSSTKSHAENPDHIRQLVQTNTCKGCDLSNAKLSGLDLTDANLMDANLEGANLANTVFTRANLRSANLKNTAISNASFIGADLREADLTAANNKGLCNNPLLFGFSVGRASTEDAKQNSRCLLLGLVSTLGFELCESDFGLNELQDAKSFCQFANENSSFSGLLGGAWGKLFQVTSFYGADVTDAVFQSVDLTGTDFRYAKLHGTDFEDSTLTYTVFLNADLQPASESGFEDAFLTLDDIKETIQMAIADEKAAKQSSP